VKSSSPTQRFRAARTRDSQERAYAHAGSVGICGRADLIAQALDVEPVPGRVTKSIGDG